MRIKTVTAQLGNMRKPQSFVVYPVAQGETVFTVQSEKSIGRFSIETGVGILNTKGNKFKHLHPATGAYLGYVFPPEFVEACKEAVQIKGSDGFVQIT